MSANYRQQTLKRPMVPPCLGLYPDEWMTIQIHVKVGTWYRNDRKYHRDSTVEFWVGREDDDLIISRSPIGDPS